MAYLAVGRFPAAYCLRPTRRADPDAPHGRLCGIDGVTGAERATLIQQAEDAEAGYVDARWCCRPATP
ncbi:MAG: hypothetical protein ACRDSL_18160 [Pseudonocardiaceae bacterium]